MKFFFQMDDLKTLNFKLDSTWQLILEGSKHGEIFYYTPNDLFWQKQLCVLASKITFSGKDFTISDKQIFALSEADIIFIRQNPPYNMDYLTTTYLLNELDSSKILFINNPTSIRDNSEKLSILKFKEFIPKTIVSKDIERILDFVDVNSKVVLKPLYSFGGNDIFCCSKDDPNLKGIINNLLSIHAAPIMVQKYLPNIVLGDKRVILIDGEIYGSFKRVPEAGDIKANLAQGGTAYPTELTKKEVEICDSLKIFLKEKGLFFAGIDLIDEKLIEINVTSPTGLVILKQFIDPLILSKIWCSILNKK